MSEAVDKASGAGIGRAPAQLTFLIGSFIRPSKSLMELLRASLPRLIPIFIEYKTASVWIFGK
ncbi:hypothetical protein DHL47_06660 [Streptococcus panodentis]|uniref:Uncharacterized protein n=1 Tax=Streptococcus panodentis TaxID=1581472 RepID=A0ABS5AWT2_9STRE|nr:hypothetical protein [Streptococcus panodentis]